MANGIKIGEVISSSAMIWDRLTRHSDRNIEGKRPQAAVLLLGLRQNQQLATSPDYGVKAFRTGASAWDQSRLIRVRNCSTLPTFL